MVEQPLPAEKVKNPPFRVVIGAVLGGGKTMNPIRENLRQQLGPDSLVYSSITTREGLQKGETIDDHHRVMAKEIVEKSGGKDLSFLVHSMGGFQVIDVIHAILSQDEWKGKKIDINFLATPGFQEKGQRGVVDLFKRLYKTVRELPQTHQHAMLPLPDEHYSSTQTDPLPTGEKIHIHTDRAEDKHARRDQFNKNMEKLIPDKGKREHLLQELKEIDVQLKLSEFAGVDTTSLLAKRAKLLDPFAPKLWSGDHLDDSLHDKYFTEYREKPENLAPVVQHFKNALLYFARTGIYMRDGMDVILKRTVDRAKQKGVDIRFGFSMGQLDSVLRPDDIQDIVRALQQANLADRMKQIGIAENMGHTLQNFNVESDLFKRMFLAQEVA